MYIDSYGNAYLNVKYEEFKRIGQNRPFKITLQSGIHKVTELCTSYYDAKGHPDMVVTVSSTGYIQIAMKIASAEQLLRLRERDQVIITFN
jgi:S-adenosylmethionine hydrolase